MPELLGILGFLEFYLSQVGIGIVPRATVIALLLQAVVAVGLLWWLRVPIRQWSLLSPTVLWVQGFAALALISAVWSEDRFESLRGGGLLAVIVAAAVLTVRSAEHARRRLVASCVNGFIVGTVTMVVLIAVELLTNDAMTRAIFTWFPSLQETPDRHVFIVNGVVVAVSEASSNRRVAIATFMLWPLAYALWHTPAGRSRTALAAVAVASYGAIYILTKHQSSQVALVFSGVAFGAMHMGKRLALTSLAVAWSLAVLLVGPVVQLAHHAQLHNAPWLFESAQQRVVIWQKTAERVWRRPFLGIGAAASKESAGNNTRGPATPDASDKKVARGHAHNAYLQTWYELGAVGAAVMLGVGLSLVRTIGRMPSRLRPVAAAQFAAVAGMMGFSFGLWQEWYLSTMALSFVAISMVEVLRCRQPLATPPGG